MRVNPKKLGIIITISLLFAFLIPINVIEAASQDNNVEWNGVYYDSRNSYYRSPLGFVYRIGSVTGDVVPPDENVTIRIRVYENDVTAVKLRVWKSYAASEQIFDMTEENADGTYEWWKVTIPAPNTIENYWYFFQLIDGSDYDCYSDDSVRDSGVGQMYDANWTPGNDYLLAYRSPPPANDPQSMVIYQIVPDRFYDSDNSNNDPSESSGLYDSRRENGNWKYYWGGDLAGIENKIDYIKGMGARGIWILPIVNNADNVFDPNNENYTSYHGYFAKDFKKIEEHFGTWGDFDNLISACEGAGIRVIMDFAPNHTNPFREDGSGENGALYDNGVFVTDYVQDNQNKYFNENTRSWENIYRHNGVTYDWDGRWELRYTNSGGMTDLNQLNPWVDNYLKESIKLYLDKGISGIRIDMSKHMDQGWLKTFADYVYAGWENIFITHEWYLGFDNPLYWDLCHFDNNNGMQALNIPLSWTLKDVFAYKTKSMYDLEAKVNQQFAHPVSDIRWNQKLGNFFDSHDTPRLLSINNDNTYLHQAFAFILTAPGIPVIYYGDEQYLHTDNLNEKGDAGGDPYNREMMKYWDTNTTAYKTIRKLSDLRLWNPALRYGLITTRSVSTNVYVYERKFFNDVALVAINKDSSNDIQLTNVSTDLPNGIYVDYLENLLGNGQSITVSGGNISSMTLPKGSVGVWYCISAADNAWLGAIDPVMGRPGTKVQINGKGFGENTGSVKFDNGSTTTNATIVSWSDNRIIFQVPSGVSPSSKHVDVYAVRADNVTSNKIKFQYLTKRQVLVVHRVDNTQGTDLETALGQFLFVTGSVPEYSIWSNRSENTLGPMLCPAWDNWFFVVSAPYSTYIEFKHIKANLGGAGTWEAGANHSYTSPENGIFYVRVEANE